MQRCDNTHVGLSEIPASMQMTLGWRNPGSHSQYTNKPSLLRLCDVMLLWAPPYQTVKMIGSETEPFSHTDKLVKLPSGYFKVAMWLLLLQQRNKLTRPSLRRGIIVLYFRRASETQDFPCMHVISSPLKVITLRTVKANGKGMSRPWPWRDCVILTRDIFVEEVNVPKRYVFMCSVSAAILDVRLYYGSLVYT